MISECNDLGCDNRMSLYRARSSTAGDTPHVIEKSVSQLGWGSVFHIQTRCVATPDHSECKIWNNLLSKGELNLMPYLFIKDPVPTEVVRWCAIPLASDCLALSDNIHDPAHRVSPHAADPSPVRLLRLGQEWALLVRPGARASVNGSRLPNGFRVLDDHAEIRLGSQRFFLSFESAAERIPYPGEKPGICPVCRLAIKPGSTVIRCPGPNCGLHHHAPDEKQWCWGYLEKCTACGHPTATDAGLRWLPEE